MTWVLEQPLPIVLIGLLSAAFLAGGWLRTGHAALLFGLLGVLFATVAMVFVERVVVTHREAVTATLQSIARRVEQNDLEGLLQHIHSEATEVRAQAQAEFPQYDFEQVKIKNNLEIDVDTDNLPPKAEARFNVVVIGSDRDHIIGRQHVPRFVIVTFHQENDQWRIYSYQHQPPGAGL